MIFKNKKLKLGLAAFAALVVLGFGATVTYAQVNSITLWKLLGGNIQPITTAFPVVVEDLTVNGTCTNCGGATGTSTEVGFFGGDGSLTGDADFTFSTSTNALTVTGGFFPRSDDGAALGSDALSFSDLYLASGGVLDFNGDVTLTHSTSTLTLAGGTLALGGNDLSIHNGTWNAGGVDIGAGDDYEIGTTDVLSATTLGASVVNSSLTSVGTLTLLGVSGTSTLATTTATSLTSDFLTVIGTNAGSVGEGIFAPDANTLGLVVNGTSEVQLDNAQLYPTTDAGNVLGSVSNGWGGLFLASSTPATTTNALYNNGGTLTFNGSAVGGGGASQCSRAYLNSAQNVTVSSETKVQFDAESYDADNNFDSSTDYDYTAPSDGMYLVTVKVTWDDSIVEEKVREIRLKKNATIIATDEQFLKGSAGESIEGSQNITDIVSMSASDTLTVYAFQSQATRALKTAADHTYISVCKI